MAIEGGLGFTFLALVIGYLPVLYQSFANREVRISLLDARAGSPPSAGELLIRQGPDPDRLEQQFANWEEWAAELLESQLSYPVLAYFRSQHMKPIMAGGANRYSRCKFACHLRFRWRPEASSRTHVRDGTACSRGPCHRF
jgi:hypothetical protein